VRSRVVKSLPFEVMGYAYDESMLMTRDGKRVEDPEPAKPLATCYATAAPVKIAGRKSRCGDFHRPDNEGFLIFDYFRRQMQG